MSPRDPLHRRIESKWTERLKSLGERIAAAIERSLPRAFDQQELLVPIPVRIPVDRQLSDRSQPR
jgi:hypothetical protein